MTMITSVMTPPETYTKSEFIDLINTISASVHAGNCYKQKSDETLDAFLDRMEGNV